MAQIICFRPKSHLSRCLKPAYFSWIIKKCFHFFCTNPYAKNSNVYKIEKKVCSLVFHVVGMVKNWKLVTADFFHWAQSATHVCCFTTLFCDANMYVGTMGQSLWLCFDYSIHTANCQGNYLSGRKWVALRKLLYSR